MAGNDFIIRFIRQLRAPEMQALPMNCAERLANHLEWRTTAPRDDGFDIPQTGNDEQDRSTLAAWLEEAADAGPYLAPSWGRGFSEALAWLLRNKHDVTPKGVVVAFIAKVDPRVADIVSQDGMEAAYAFARSRWPKKG